MTNWKARFEEVLTELEQHPLIRVLESSIGEPAEPSVIERASGEGLFELAPDLKELYESVDGFEIEWEVEEGSAIEAPEGACLRGIIRLHSLEDLLESEENVAESSRVYEEDEDRIKGETFFILDQFIEEGAGVLLQTDRGLEAFFQGERMAPLGVGVSGYVDYALKARGFWYWTSAIAAPEYGSLPMSLEEESLRAVLPQLFPGTDPEVEFVRLVRGEVDTPSDAEALIASLMGDDDDDEPSKPWWKFW